MLDIIKIANDIDLSDPNFNNLSYSGVEKNEDINKLIPGQWAYDPEMKSFTFYIDKLSGGSIRFMYHNMGLNKGDEIEVFCEVDHPYDNIKFGVTIDMINYTSGSLLEAIQVVQWQRTNGFIPLYHKHVIPEILPSEDIALRVIIGGITSESTNYRSSIRNIRIIVRKKNLLYNGTSIKRIKIVPQEPYTLLGSDQNMIYLNTDGSVDVYFSFSKQTLPGRSDLITTLPIGIRPKKNIIAQARIGDSDIRPIVISADGRITLRLPADYTLPPNSVYYVNGWFRFYRY